VECVLQYKRTPKTSFKTVLRRLKTHQINENNWQIHTTKCRNFLTLITTTKTPL